MALGRSFLSSSWPAGGALPGCASREPPSLEPGEPIGAAAAALKREVEPRLPRGLHRPGSATHDVVVDLHIPAELSLAELAVVGERVSIGSPRTYAPTRLDFASKVGVSSSPTTRRFESPARSSFSRMSREPAVPTISRTSSHSPDQQPFSFDVAAGAAAIGNFGLVNNDVCPFPLNACTDRAIVSNFRVENRRVP